MSLKRLFWIILLCISMPLQSFASSSDVLVSFKDDSATPDYLISIAVSGNTAGILGCDSFYTWNADTAALVKYALPDETEYITMSGVLFSIANDFYLMFSSYEDESDPIFSLIYLYRIVLSEERNELQLEYCESFDISDELCPGEFILLDSEEKTLLIRTIGDVRETLKIDLADESIEVADENYMDIAFYGNGNMIAAIRDSEDSGMIRLVILDNDFQEIDEITSLISDQSLYGLAVDETDNTLYYTIDGTLCSLDIGNPETTQMEICEISVEASYGMNASLTDSGLYLFGDFETLIACSVTQDRSTQQVLNINDLTGNAAITDARDKMYEQGENVQIAVDSNTSEDIITAMLTQNSKYDVYCLYANSSEYQALYDRGYLADMSESTVISSCVNRTYDFIRQSVTLDGKIVALPIEVFTYSLSYYPDTLAELGLDESDLPKTWIEFPAFLEQVSAIAEDQDVCIFASDDLDQLKYNIMCAMLASYEGCYKDSDAKFRYDTDMFRTLLDAFQSIPFAEFQLYDPEDENQISLFVPYDAIDGVNNMKMVSPLCLSLDIGSNLTVGCELYVVIINPYTENYNLALSYVEQVSDCVSDISAYYLYKDENAPVRGDYYQAILDGKETEIVQLESEIAAAAYPDTQDLQEQLEDLNAYYQDLREQLWELSPLEIERYSTLINYRVLLSNDAVQEYADVVDSIRQYLSGIISDDQFISKLEQYITMERLEISN